MSPLDLVASIQPRGGQAREKRAHFGGVTRSPDVHVNLGNASSLPPPASARARKAVDETEPSLVRSSDVEQSLAKYTRSKNNGCLTLIIVLLVLWALGAPDKRAPIGLLVALAVIYAGARFAQRKRLVHHYGEAIAARISARVIWQGAMQDAVVEMLGQPSDVATNVRKDRKTEIWKYVPTGRGRYALKIEFENGKCVGWETL